jgi:putative ABC transport system permease protein
MLYSFYKIALRNLLKHKLFSALNIVGLGLGLTCTVLILLWVKDELSFDQFYSGSERIYRITEHQTISDNKQQLATTSGPLAEAVVKNIPEVEAAVRVLPRKKSLLSVEEKSFYEQGLIYSDPSFLQVFKLKWIQGNKSLALNTPNSIILSQSLALKYFNSEDIVGREMKLNNKTPLQVNGVFEDNPDQTHLHFQSVVSLSTLNSPAWITQWGIRGGYTYILLKSPEYEASVKKKLGKVVVQNFGVEYRSIIDYRLQSIQDIHLNSHLLEEIEPNGDLLTVYVFSVIALIILFLAGSNYINLFIAQSIGRLKEIGLRKTLGVSRTQLTVQFLMEAFLHTSIALVIALILVEFSLPTLNLYLGKKLQLLFSEDVHLFLYLVLLLSFTTLISGVYPALKLSAYQPVEAISNRIKNEGNKIRNILAVTQFSISITLIIVSSIVFKQFEYIENKKPGFDKDNLIIIKGLELTSYKGKPGIIKDAFLRNPDVKKAAASLLEPGEEGYVSEVRLESSNSKENLIFSISSVDHDYFETIDAVLVAGRNFRRGVSNDTLNAFILNETAVKKLGFKSPEEAIGKRLRLLSDGSVREVIGVAKDFHVGSFHNEIPPVLYFNAPEYTNKLILRISSKNYAQTISGLQQTWKKILPLHPFEFSFVEDGINKMYQKDQLMRDMLWVFTLLTVIIACIGLFGTAAFSFDVKLKEIGIRKVLGAPFQNLLYVLSKDFILLIFISILISMPLGWYLSNQWLLDFAYRIKFDLLIFPMAWAFTISITFITISGLLIKASFVNPINIIRDNN